MVCVHRQSRVWIARSHMNWLRPAIKGTLDSEPALCDSPLWCVNEDIRTLARKCFLPILRLVVERGVSEER